ncbi:hypothetical protein V8E54_000865 [Elaphomyces granulatus]
MVISNEKCDLLAGAGSTGIRAKTDHRHRIQLSGCYLILACTGARPAEVVDNEKKKCKDGCLEELFGPKVIGTSTSDDGDEALDDNSRLLEDLSQETVARGRPKALCYEDILLMVVRHPETGEDVLAMSIKFIHHKGADNNPKPTIFFFTTTRRLMFCLITVIVSLATKNLGPVKCTPFRWKEWLKRPVFRRFDNSIISDEPGSGNPRLSF